MRRASGTVFSMSEQLQLTIHYGEPSEDGWIFAAVYGVPGAYSQGRTREEARANVIDALRLVLTPDDDENRRLAKFSTERLIATVAG